jgi:DNA polymerase III epsilon subunit family exonuclease
MYHAQPRLTDVTFVAFDTETTGLHPMVHRLVEIGAICFRLDSRETTTFQSLINPQIPIPLDVQQVHGITDRMVRGQPTVDQILPRFIEFLGESDTILLAHNVPFDLSFLAMALIRLGIACPPYCVFDTLDMARRLYPAWHRHRLEHVTARLKIAKRAEHRALSDARLVKEIFQAMLRHTPTLTNISELMCVSQPLTFADAPVCAIEPPPGFEALSTALTERCAITIMYDHGWHRPTPRVITPRLVLEVHGIAYVIAHCHLSEAERTFRLDRIRECWLT